MVLCGVVCLCARGAVRVCVFVCRGSCVVSVGCVYVCMCVSLFA